MVDWSQISENTVPCQLFFFIATWRTLITGRTLTYNTTDYVAYATYYAIDTSLDYNSYSTFYSFFFWDYTPFFFCFLLRTVLITNISPLQYIHVFFFSFFFFIQIICFNYSAARTLLNAVQTTSFWELPCTKGQFQRENMNPFSIKRIIFIVLITYVTYLASENSSVKASKQAFKEVTGTGTQSLRNNSPQRSSNSRGVLHNYSSFVRYFPKIVFMRHSGFPDSNLPSVCLQSLSETPPRGRNRVVDRSDW